jgi:hypothetical protein
MKIDTAQVPVETGKKLAISIADGVRKYLAQPGGRAELDRRTAARHERERRKAIETAALSQV